MRKEVILSVLIFLALVSVALASATSAGFNPDTFYEAQTHQFNLSINNFAYTKMINEVNLALSGFTITEVTDFLGWSNSFTNTTVRWFDGSIETNVLLALFQFKAAAPLVTENQSSNVDVTVKYTDGTSQVFQIPVMLLNDYTGPVLSNNVPMNGGYLKANSGSQLISVEAVDAETGVKEVKFKWRECGNGTNSERTFTCNSTSNVCTRTIDLSSYDEGEQLCFEFRATNNANELTLLSGTAGFDGTPPSIQLISPAEGASVGLFGTFTFKATDNIATTLECDFVLDGTIYDSVQVQNNVVSNITVNFTSVAEGNHTWRISCSDEVGLNGNSATQGFFLDNTSPTITLNSPANGSIIPDTATIDVTVTDNYGLAGVQTSHDLNDLTKWTSGRNNVVVTATDNSGNVATRTFTFFIDRSAPIISNLVPGDGANIDVHVDFTFDIDDDYDPSIDCQLFLNGQEHSNDVFTNGGSGIFATSLALGAYNWSIQCIDDAGNTVNTPQRSLTTIDSSGPDIALQDVVTVARGDTFTIDATVTDVSGVDYVYGKLGSTIVGLDKSGNRFTQDVATSSSSTLGNYTYTVYANDTLGYSSSESDVFLLVKGYVFTLSLNPSTATPGSTVTLTGNVVGDDNSNIPEGSLRLILPGETVTLTIDANGDFSYTFTAPGSDGTYDISVEIDGNNGHTYRGSVQLAVQSPAGSRSGSGTGRGFKPKTEKTPTEVLSENPDNENIFEDEGNDDETGSDGDGGEPVVVEKEPIEKDVIHGIGQSTGFFSAPIFKWLGALILAMIVISLAVMAFSRMKRQGPRREEWDNYLERKREE
jgi:hypothetical protein